MRYRSVVVFSLLFAAFGVYAQEDNSPKVNMEAVKPDEELVKPVNKSQDRIVAEFSFNQLIGKSDSLDIRWHSRGFNIYFMYDQVLGKSPISIAGGFGVGNDNYYMRNRVAFDTATNITHFFPLDKDIYDYKKNKFSLTYIDLPIEIRYRSKPNTKNTSWKLAAGFKLGFHVGDKWKYKGKDPRDGVTPGEEVKFKEFKVDNVELLRYGVSARGGYGIFNLFVNYYISDIFKEGKGPSGNPITFGIAINGL